MEVNRGSLAHSQAARVHSSHGYTARKLLCLHICMLCVCMCVAKPLRMNVVGIEVNVTMWH